MSEQNKTEGFTGWIGVPVFKPRWEFELWQNDVVAASGEGPDQDSVHREGWHYASQYVQDGPCRLVFKHIVEEHEIAGPSKSIRELWTEGAGAPQNKVVPDFEFARP